MLTVCGIFMVFTASGQKLALAITLLRKYRYWRYWSHEIAKFGGAIIFWSIRETHYFKSV